MPDPRFDNAFALARRLFTAGDLDRADDVARQIAGHDPTYHRAHHLRGAVAMRQGRHGDAEPHLRLAAAGMPRDPEVHTLLAISLGRQGKLAAAIEALRVVVAVRPDDAAAWNDLAAAWFELQKLGEAESAGRRAVELSPGDAGAHANLGAILRSAQKLDEAIVVLERAVELNPALAAAHNNLGKCHQESARPEEAVVAYRRALDAAPDDPRVHSNLIYSMHYPPGSDARAIFAAHIEWARRHAPGDAPSLHRVTDRTPDRPLRVGYMSPDFRENPVTRFLERLLGGHDRRNHQVYVYSDTPYDDEVSARVRGKVDHWRTTYGLSHDAMQRAIIDDRIDVLVDCSVHVGQSRLVIHRARLAPVVVNHIGYPNTSGLATFDIKFTDAFHDPPGMTQHLWTERLVRIDGSAWSYMGDDVIDHRAAPVTRCGYVTFGSVNNVIKLNEPLIDAWASVLRRVPRSRLMLLTGGGRAIDDRLADWFARRGIEAQRLRFVQRRPRRQYLALFAEIDLALDPFPYVGHTTTMDTLLSGVPLVTLTGDCHYRRTGLGPLTRIGLGDLAAADVDGYVAAAAGLGLDIDRLVELRREIRDRMLAAGYMAEAPYARKVEAGYREAWLRWAER